MGSDHPITHPSPRHVYLMRGLPSCGKSYRAAELAGADGVVCETDAYFYSEVGDDPESFDYRADLMGAARRWNFDRFCAAVVAGRSPVVVDRGNALSAETRAYTMYALEHGYTVSIEEPTSPQWQEIRVLLKYKHLTGPALDEWAQRLAAMNRSTHRVPVATIRRWMDKWKWNLTVDKIVRYQPAPGA